MSIRIKAILFIVLISIVGMVSMQLMANGIILKNFDKLEIESMTRNIARVRNIVNEQISQIDNFATDYGAWDDTYQYVDDKNIEYEKSTLLDDTFISTKLDLIVIVNTKGEIVYEKLYDYKNKTRLEIPSSLYKNIKVGSPLLRHNSETEGLSGIITLPELTLLVASKPIVTSEKSGPIRGSIIMGRILDSDLVSELNKIASIKLDFYSLGTGNDPEFYNSSMSSEKIEAETEKDLSGDLIFQDINNQRALLARLTMPRDIHNQGETVVGYFMWSFAGISIVTTVIMLLIIETSIIRPIQSFARDVNKIRVTRNFTQRIGDSGSLEISVLATDVNNMLESLEKTSKSLYETNLELARQKAGVEHTVAERTRQLREEQSEFIASINSLAEGFILINRKQKVSISNAKLNEIMGLDDTITVDIIDKLFGTEFEFKNTITKVFGDKTRIQVPQIKFGTKILSVYVAPVYQSAKDNTVIGAVAIISDITEAVTVARSKDEFFSIASHELRTPLAAIKGNTEMLETYFSEKIGDKNFNEITKDIYSASKRLIDIVNTFLTTSRLEQSKIIFKNTAFNMDDVINNTIRQLNIQLTKNNNVIKYLNNVHGIVAFADSSRTEEVLINLVDNANKHTQNGTITISTDYDKTSEMITVSISDTGAGIDKSEQHLLFHKFQQAQSSLYTRDMSQGTGLGLYISRLIIEEMNGKIELVNSEPGKGSTFAFSLPVAKV